MRTVTHSMEDYLKTILVIGKEKPVVRAVDISARMRVTKPSVHRAVQLLREEGYIEVSENNHIRLTEQGLMTAQAVNERHEFFVRLLSAAGVPRNVLVTNIRFGSFPGRTRVVIDMKDTPRQTRFSQSKDRRQLDVRVDQ